MPSKAPKKRGKHKNTMGPVNQPFIRRGKKGKKPPQEPSKSSWVRWRRPVQPRDVW